MLKKQLKRWLLSIPFFRQRFRYFGYRVFFPENSGAIEQLCQSGIYEYENLSLLLELVTGESTFIDVGANVGLMVLPILAQRRCKAIAFEPSPNAAPYLQKTRQVNGLQDRLEVVARALGAAPGLAQFSVAAHPSFGPLDGLRDTGRAGAMRSVEVELSTLDREWARLGSPPVAVVKIDVEGAEYDVLSGATSLIRANRPIMMIEWNAANLRAYQRPADAILRFCAEIQYSVLGFPMLLPAEDRAGIIALMAGTETFVLVPKEKMLGKFAPV